MYQSDKIILLGYHHTKETLIQQFMAGRLIHLLNIISLIVGATGDRLEQMQKEQSISMVTHTIFMKQHVLINHRSSATQRSNNTGALEEINGQKERFLSAITLMLGKAMACQWVKCMKWL